MGDLQIANILQLANIMKENRKENLEQQIDEKISQSIIRIEEGKLRYWMIDSSASSQNSRLKKAFHIEETNKPLTCGWLVSQKLVWLIKLQGGLLG